MRLSRLDLNNNKTAIFTGYIYQQKVWTIDHWAAGCTGSVQGHNHAIYKGRREIHTFPSRAMI